MADEQDKINIDNARTLGRIEQSIEDMSTRLFGGPGQTGALTYLAQQHKEHAAEVEIAHKKLGTRLGDLESWKKGTLRWVAGAVFVLSCEGTALAFYFHNVVAFLKKP